MTGRGRKKCLAEAEKNAWQRQKKMPGRGRNQRTNGAVNAHLRSAVHTNVIERGR